MKSKIVTDLSRINQSKTTIPLSQYSKLKEEIRLVKYPTYAFSEAEKLSNKINTFKDEAVRNKLTAQLSSLNSYRKVRGDGNCFFRALAFSYICGVPVPSYNNCFQYIDQIQLDCCYPDSIPKMFKKFYDHKFLQNVLKQYWQQILSRCTKQSNNIKNKALLKLFDQNPFLDFIIILYFRAVCLKALFKHQGQFIDYITGGQEASIRSYSEETQGISIKLCSKILNITIFVYEVRQHQIHSYHYDASKIHNGTIHHSIALLFNENHYDILENNPNIEAERCVLKKKSTYYDEVNQSLVNGQCVQCNTKGYVYEISRLCLKCHEASLASLNEFKKDKLTKANCQQCKRLRDDVSTSFGLCVDCINYQNYMVPSKKCSLCNRIGQLDQETMLCQSCLSNQKQLMNHMESSKKSFEKPQRVQPNNQDNQNNGNFVLRSGIKDDKSKLRDNSSEYNTYTCKKCNNMSLTQPLKNGFCKVCQSK